MNRLHLQLHAAMCGSHICGGNETDHKRHSNSDCSKIPHRDKNHEKAHVPSHTTATNATAEDSTMVIEVHDTPSASSAMVWLGALEKHSTSVEEIALTPARLRAWCRTPNQATHTIARARTGVDIHQPVQTTAIHNAICHLLRHWKRGCRRALDDTRVSKQQATQARQSYGGLGIDKAEEHRTSCFGKARIAAIL